jgi:hypothetical protein
MTSILSVIRDHDQAHTPQPQQPDSVAHAPILAPSHKAIWSGRIVSGVAILFLALDATMKLLMAAPAVQTTTELGYPSSVIFPLGVVQLACLALYLIPRTTVLGAVLWTAYLGGAVATHVRVGSPLFSHVLFPVYIATMLWLGLWLRNARVRTLLPLR